MQVKASSLAFSLLMLPVMALSSLTLLGHLKLPALKLSTSAAHESCSVRLPADRVRTPWFFAFHRAPAAGSVYTTYPPGPQRMHIAISIPVILVNSPFDRFFPGVCDRAQLNRPGQVSALELKVGG
jgi:hypothetical protein